MKNYITLLIGVSLLLACQNKERATDGSGSPATENINAANTAADQSNEVLAKRSLNGMKAAGTDIDPTDGKNDELNDDIKLPPNTRYATYYLGSYASTGQCSDKNKILELDKVTIGYGEAKCQIKNMSKSGDAIKVDVDQCIAEGKKVTDRSYTLNLFKMDALEVSGAANGNLVRCGSDG